MSRAAGVINQVLSVPEVSIAPLLELTAYEVRAVHRAVGVPATGTTASSPKPLCPLQIFEQDLKKKAAGSVPLEFIPAKGLLGRQDDLCTQLFTLS